MRKPIFLILFVSYVLFSNAQDANQAMDFLLNKNYPAAQEEYDKLYNESPQELEYLYYSAVCDLKLKNENSAIDKLNKILAPVRKNPKASRAEYNVSMLLAECYHNIYMFDQELTIYSRLLKKEFKRKEEKTIRLKIKQANDAKKLFMEFKQIVVTQLAIINSKYDDHTPIPDSSGQRIFFTSKRKGSTGGELSPEGKFYEDIYVWNRNLGLWSKPYNIGPPINTAAHEATAGVSLSGNTLFIFKAGKKNPGDLYVSYRTDTVWSKPVKLGKNVNKKYSREQHAALSPDENTLYFTSDRRRGEGGSDIWISGKEDDGSWGKPENAPFNTEFDEGAPFIFNNGKTIYFSSKGYAGMGGFDVYKSEQKEDGTWSEPENIGFPINTVDDDIFYFPAGNENIAYFTRRKGGSANIYKAQLYGEYEQFIIVQGLVMDNKFYTEEYAITRTLGDSVFYADGFRLKSQKELVYNDSVVTSLVVDSNIVQNVYFVPDEEQITVFDLWNEKYLDLYQTNTNKGDYKFIIKPENNYKIVYEADGLLFDTKNIYTDSTETEMRIEYDAVLTHIEEGKTEKVKLTPFDFGKSDLNKFTLNELDIIKKYLDKYPQLVVNFSAQNSNSEDQNLLEEREQNAATYLADNGIDRDRIKTGLSLDTIPENKLQYVIYDEQMVAGIEEENINIQDSIEEVNRQREEEKITTITIENPYFAFDGKFLLKKNTVDSLAGYLADNPEAKILIIGYTDGVGSASYNKHLSESRAQTVKGHLISEGASPEQIRTEGYGETNPVALNKLNGRWHEPSKKFNRRVEIRIEMQGEPKVNLEQLKDIPQKFKSNSYSDSYTE